MTSQTSTRRPRPARSRPPASPRMPARRALPGRPFPLGATPGEHLGVAGTNFAIASSVADSVTLCLFDEAGTETQIPLPTTTPTSGTRSCRASARARPTGTGSTAPGIRPGACGATRPSCCSTRTPRRSADRSRSGPRCSARTQADPAEPSTLDSAGARAAEPGRRPRVRLAGRQTALVPVRGHGHLRGPRQGLHHAPPGHPARAARDLRRPGPRGRHRAPDATWASPPSSCCRCTRTCPRRS